MFLTHTARRGWRSLSCLWLVLVLALAQLHPAQAQLPSPAPKSDPLLPLAPQQSTITWKTCDPPVVCFRSKEARQQWAQKNQCKFLEDVCEGTPPSQDNKGAKDEDKGFWGDLWDDIKTGLVYGYEFVKGLIHGFMGQVVDLWNLVTNPGEVINGLIELGKAFFNDPAGTLEELAKLLGQEAADIFKRSTQCGAYASGKTVGGILSPALAFKVAMRLSKYTKLAEAVRLTKKDMGCASFAAGTLIQTPQGMVPIEQIRAGQQVHSRHDRLFIDAPQTVTKTFTRTAPSYRFLTTELDLLKLTDEHPLWVQGKGWTQAQHITDDDVIAGANGDVLVLNNQPIKQARVVYNFSVAKTANYFVGEAAAWAHNTHCGLPHHKEPPKPNEYKLGTDDGGPGKWVKVKRPKTDDYKYEKQITGAPRNVEYEVNGVKFDGYDAERKVLLDAKHYSTKNPLMKEDMPKFFEDDILKQAWRQRDAAGDGAIEWHVANKEVADKLRTILKKEEERGGGGGGKNKKKLDIKVIFTPSSKIKRVTES